MIKFVEIKTEKPTDKSVASQLSRSADLINHFSKNQINFKNTVNKVKKHTQDPKTNSILRKLTAVKIHQDKTVIEKSNDYFGYQA